MRSSAQEQLLEEHIHCDENTCRKGRLMMSFISAAVLHEGKTSTEMEPSNPSCLKSQWRSCSSVRSEQKVRGRRQISERVRVRRIRKTTLGSVYFTVKESKSTQEGLEETDAKVLKSSTTLPDKRHKSSQRTENLGNGKRKIFSIELKSHRWSRDDRMMSSLFIILFAEYFVNKNLFFWVLLRTHSLWRETHIMII